MALGKIHISYLNDIKWHTASTAHFVIPLHDTHVYGVNITKNMAFFDTLLALLTPTEVSRANKFIRKADRSRFVISHGVLRYVLGIYLGVPPGEIEFSISDNKKPCLTKRIADHLHFNISHSGDWALLSVASAPLGCDVEYIDGNFSFKELLAGHFCADETKYIQKENAAERFYTLWTRKEALLKATGQGLNEYLSEFSALDGLHTRHQSLSGDVQRWKLNSFKIMPDYVGSIAFAGSGRPQFYDIDLNKITA